MFQAHVFVTRRSKLHNTASGIITLIGGRLVYKTATYRCDDEAWNKTYCETNFVYQVGQILR